MKILVIIPAYNEEDNIAKVITEITEIESINDIDYLVINDCSKDRTGQVLNQMKASYVRLPVNLGIGGGVQTGYIYAKEHNYDIAVQMDGDGQHDAQYLKKIIQPILEERADFVIGSRFINKDGFQSSALRRVGINFLSALIRLCCGVTVKDATSGFRAVNKRMIDYFASDYAQDYPEPEAIVSAALQGAKIIEVPVIMRERVSGASSISSFKSLYYMIKVSMAILLQRFSLGGKRK